MQVHDDGGQYRPFKLLLQRMELTHLRHLEGRKTAKPLRSAKPVIAARTELLAALAWVGHAKELHAAAVFDSAMQTFLAAYGKATVDAPLGPLDLAAADRALSRLSNTSTAIERRLLKACAACIETDGVATVEEFELLRVIAGRCHVRSWDPDLAILSGRIDWWARCGEERGAVSGRSRLEAVVRAIRTRPQDARTGRARVTWLSSDR